MRQLKKNTNEMPDKGGSNQEVMGTHKAPARLPHQTQVPPNQKREVQTENLNTKDKLDLNNSKGNTTEHHARESSREQPNNRQNISNGSLPDNSIKTPVPDTNASGAWKNLGNRTWMPDNKQTGGNKP